MNDRQLTLETNVKRLRDQESREKDRWSRRSVEPVTRPNPPTRFINIAEQPSTELKNELDTVDENMAALHKGLTRVSQLQALNETRALESLAQERAQLDYEKSKFKREKESLRIEHERLEQQKAAWEDGVRFFMIYTTNITRSCLGRQVHLLLLIEHASLDACIKLITARSSKIKGTTSGEASNKKRKVKSPTLKPTDSTKITILESKKEKLKKGLTRSCKFMKMDDEQIQMLFDQIIDTLED